MKEDHYVYIKGKFQPINVVPSGQIKCCTCSKYFSSEAIQDHLNTHIKPQFLRPRTNQNKIQKILAPKDLELLTNDDSDIDIQSILPDQLPEQQHQRKFIVPPTGQEILENSKNSSISENRSKFFFPNFKTHEDEEDLTSNLGIRRKTGNPEQFEILALEDKLDIPLKSANITKKNIHLFKNQRQGVALIDETTSKKKYHLTQNIEPLEYVIREDEKILTQSTITQRSGKRIPFNYKRIPAGSTILTSKSNLKHSHVRDDISDESEVRPFKLNEIQQNKMCDNKCPCCKGFYCSYCKSTIPPKYRPVEQVSPEQQQQIREFYRSYHKKPCQNCDK